MTRALQFPHLHVRAIREVCLPVALPPFFYVCTGFPHFLCCWLRPHHKRREVVPCLAFHIIAQHADFHVPHGGRFRAIGWPRSCSLVQLPVTHVWDSSCTCLPLATPPGPSGVGRRSHACLAHVLHLPFYPVLLCFPCVSFFPATRSHPVLLFSFARSVASVLRVHGQAEEEGAEATAAEATATEAAAGTTDTAGIAALRWSGEITASST